MKVDIEHLNALAGTLEGLAGEAGGLKTQSPSVDGDVLESVKQAASIGDEDISGVLVSAVRERLGETAETMRASAKMYHDREGANSQLIAGVLSAATGEWGVGNG